jgi:hypothetical protein
MRLVRISPEENEDEQFVSLVRNLIHGIVQSKRPKVYCVVRVDNWFSDRWLNFSGKMLGRLSVRKLGRITFPPFVPSRLRNGGMFEWIDQDNNYVKVEKPPLFHKWQKSTDNFQNFVDRAYPDSAFFWFSGNTKVNSRGSLMGYIAGSYPDEGLDRTAQRRDRRAQAEQPFWTWYLEFNKEAGWKHSKGINITPEQFKFYIEKCVRPENQGDGANCTPENKPQRCRGRRETQREDGQNH